MNKIFLLYLITIVVALFLGFVPQSAFASELTFKIVSLEEVSENVTLVEVRIDPQSKKLNVVEGIISFSGSATENLSVQIENGNSILPLWPTPPQYVLAEKAIHFTGGVPGGFDVEGLLFIMRLTSSVGGDLEISYIDGTAYLNDGKGTKENVFSKSLKISLNKSNNNLSKENLFIYKNKYAILVLIVIILIFIVFYGYKKFKQK